MIDLHALIADFVALWNEPDGVGRRRLLERVYTPEATHVSRGRVATGYDALHARVTLSYDRSVRQGGHRFVACENAERLEDVAKFDWRMVDADGRTAAIGLEVLTLAADGRIAREYQFIEPGPIA